MATTPTIRGTTISRMCPRDNRVGGTTTGGSKTEGKKLITKGNIGYRTPAPATSPSSNDRNAKEGEFGQYGKLNHLVKDVRQRGGNRGKQTEGGSTNGKIINMVYEKRDIRKRKFQKKREEDWMNAPITFPPIPFGQGCKTKRGLTNDENSKEWTLFTDGASSLKGAGAELVLIDPASTEYTYAIRLNFTSTKSEAEYEALLAGLPIAGKMKVRALKVKMDSKLVACQLNDEFVSNSDGVAKYLAKAKELLALFKKFSIENVLNTKSVEAREINATVEEEEDNWITLIVKCLEEDIWPKDKNEARALRMKISQYVMEEGILFKKSYMSPMLRARFVVAKIMRQGYYWPSMHRDTKEFMDRSEIDMPTYRTIHWNEAQNEEEMRLILDFIQERREIVAIRESKYKKKVNKYYNKRVHPMSFKIGDFVYWKNEVSHVEKQGKLVQIRKDHTI
ncbi:reverse transcriptase domain-containing protein [Tanacetum coccineum]